MPRGNPNWTKGASGNPDGRPPKGRALTEILEKTGSKMVEVKQPDGTVKRVSGKRLLAAMVWELVTTGSVTLPDGKVKPVEDFNDWFAAVQFIYKHIDGPPPKPVELTGKDGGAIVINLDGLLDDGDDNDD